jgi:hypothetical protein
MGKSHVNGIVILDAIPDGEYNTARRLKENLDDISLYIADGLQIRYYYLNTIDDLKAGMAEVLDEINNSNLMPWLHLEGHGLSDENGFQLASGEICTWSQLKEIIIPLNIGMGLNLLLILATCFGGSFARAIMTVDRAPVLGLIGPKYEIKVGKVEKDFQSFYRILFESSSLKKALEVLNATEPQNLYFRATAEQFFYEVWKGYKNKCCTEQEINNRVKRMYRKAKSQQLPRTPSIGQLKRLLHSQEVPLFEKYRDTYFMYDIYESNRERFPVSYREAEKYSKR